MKKGDHVIINTKFGGMYCGKSGTVRYITTTDQRKIDGEWIRWSPSCEGWYEVWFDTPFFVGNTNNVVTHDVFLPSELELYKEV